jgi:Cu/Ag efflux pump CusA
MAIVVVADVMTFALRDLRMTDVARRILEGLEDLMRRIKNKESVPITEVRRVDTPDGPMHVRTEKTLGDEDE